VAAVAAVALALFTDAPQEPWAFALFVFAAFAIAGLAQEFWNGASARRKLAGGSLPAALVGVVSRNRRRYGGYVVHAAIVLLAIGIAGSSAYSSSTIRKLTPGQSVSLAGYTLTLQNVVRRQVPNATETRAILDVKGRWSGTISSGDNQYVNPPEPSREVGLKTNWLRAEDLYVIADSINPATKTVYVKVLVKPLVNLIWVAGFVFVLGSLIALWPDAREQRRLVTRLAPAQA
jgi:cytochrome c-type biogenesis protein CcmF